jgi:glycosyltransferase involved in cell wall biosynthesis
MHAGYMFLQSYTNMSTAPLVSILLPTKNGADYLSRAVQGVQLQSYRYWELIIIDDGSTDATPKLLQQLAKDEPRVKTLRVEQPYGVPGALLAGMRIARGEFVARLDDDDQWADVEKLSMQVMYLEQHPQVVLVGTGVIVQDAQGRELWRFVHPESDADIRRMLLGKNCFVNSSVLFRRSAYNAVGGYDVFWKYIEDYDLWLKLGREGVVANLPAYTTRYTVRQGNVTSTKHRQVYTLAIRLAHAHRRYYSNYLLAQVRNFYRLFLYWRYPKLY